MFINTMFVFFYQIRYNRIDHFLCKLFLFVFFENIILYIYFIDHFLEK